MRVLPYGTRAVLVEVEDLDRAARLHAALLDDPPPGTGELVPAARTVLVHYDPARTDPARLGAALRALDLRAAPAAGAAPVTIEVRYDGEDLAEIGRLTGLTPAQVVARHTAAAYRVAFCGFAPGFAYLTGVDPALRVPRRAAPRTRVPAGAVALADEFTGVYPRESPGGWQLLGTTRHPLWDPSADPPTPLTPGTAVRFTAV
ncbi:MULTISPECIES: allophanate hydrolase subunit 1 [Kitasatospora]|uniref:Putative regulatory protein n=1 Tax=Kitasatospora setae (strain ATCC 33774 / DSM 43861 / JCM 3304 / KCC A-0304 / NBRC 14216 / KM-6054) TaxID=452652 RepID=E4N0Q8_KITSK|nr:MULTISPECIES: allophanate hydrolase subunit 1 [Kitasatospora]BAJ31742.1 putative regulatory protein [Kitasatospora setae KM-6054]